MDADRRGLTTEDTEGTENEREPLTNTDGGLRPEA